MKSKTIKPAANRRGHVVRYLRSGVFVVVDLATRTVLDRGPIAKWKGFHGSN